MFRLRSNVWALLVMLSVSRLAWASDLVLSFEQGSHDWTGDSVAGGPWPVTEWSVFGRGSLKADVILAPGASYSLRKMGDQDLSRYGWVSAVITRSWWGDFGENLYARLYVKTGPHWEWHEGLTVPVAPSFSDFYYADNTALDLDLRSIPNLDQVREIGVQFYSGPKAQGKAAVYVGQVRLTEKAPGLAFPSWVYPRTAVDDGFGRYFAVTSQGLAALDPARGQVLWERHFTEPVQVYFPKTNFDEAVYVVSPGAVWSLNRNNGMMNWTRSIPQNAYVQVTKDQEQAIYFYIFIGDERQLHAIDKKDGSTRWQVEGIELSGLADDSEGTLYAEQGVVAVIAEDGVTHTHTIGGIEKSSGQWLWSYADGFGSSFRLYASAHGTHELYILGESDSHHYIRGMEGNSGSPLWVYEARGLISVASTEGAGNALFLQIFNQLVALDRATGQEKWTHDAGGFFTLTLDPLQRPYLRSWQDSQETLTALEPDGKVRWAYTSRDGSVLMDTREVYVLENTASRHRITFIDRETGQVRWSEEAVAQIFSVWNEGDIYILVSDNRFTAFDPRTGTHLWTFIGEANSWVLQADSRNVYVLTQDKLYAQPPRLFAVDRSQGRLRWEYHPGSFLGGLVLGAQRGAEAAGHALFQYIVGSKFPITQGVVALPQDGSSAMGWQTFCRKQRGTLAGGPHAKGNCSTQARHVESGR